MQSLGKSALIAAFSAVAILQACPAHAEDAVGAWKLYQQKQYEASANAFEKVSPASISLVNHLVQPVAHSFN